MKQWWKEAVIYQIYPRSFCDLSGDGIGDIKGITSKLDYLKDLGIDAVWLSPVYASPNCDNGYDISDYRAIHPDFGTMDDFDQMLKGLKQRGIRLIMDLVVNHTSDEHEWFQRAISGDPEYRDYYYIRQGIKKGNRLLPPNNWTSFFGGKAWERIAGTDEFYLHLFDKKQPDLNFENKRVREQVQDIVRFWLDKGVDGFRCDVINIISKAEGLPNGKPNIALVGKEHYLCGPRFREFFKEIKDNVLDPYGAMTVGESVLMDIDTASSYLNERDGIFNMFFHFEHMNVDCHFVKWFPRKYKPYRLKRVLSKWQLGLDGWNSLYFENHDQPRCVSRFGSEAMRTQSARMLASLLFFQKGTPYIYQGQEIGMTNAHFACIDDYQDVETKNIYKIGKKLFGRRSMVKRMQHASRDNARTPMQWTAERGAGFTEGAPWLKINPNHEAINVQSQGGDSESVLSYYKKLIEFRRQNPVTVYGSYIEHLHKDRQIWAIERRSDDNSILMLANMSGREAKIKQGSLTKSRQVCLCSYETQGEEQVLRPYEVRIYK